MAKFLWYPYLFPFFFFVKINCYQYSIQAKKLNFRISSFIYHCYTSNYKSEIYLKADVNYICDVYIPRSNKSACLHTIYTHRIHTVALRNTIYLIPSNIWVTHSHKEEEILSSNLKCPLKQEYVYTANRSKKNNIETIFCLL